MSDERPPPIIVSPRTLAAVERVLPRAVVVGGVEVVIPRRRPADKNDEARPTPKG